MKRVMALDVGFKRIGVAVSDPLLLISRPYTIIYRKSNRETFEELLKLISTLNVEKIIVGIPINARGDETKVAKKIKKFVSKFESFLKEQEKETELEFVDESYSTMEAEELCRLLGKKERKEVDDIAAALILKEWLENRDSLP